MGRKSYRKTGTARCCIMQTGGLIFFFKFLTGYIDLNEFFKAFLVHFQISKWSGVECSSQMEQKNVFFLSLENLTFHIFNKVSSFLNWMSYEVQAKC